MFAALNMGKATEEPYVVSNQERELPSPQPTEFKQQDTPFHPLNGQGKSTHYVSWQPGSVGTKAAGRAGAGEPRVPAAGLWAEWLQPSRWAGEQHRLLPFVRPVCPRVDFCGRPGNSTGNAGTRSQSVEAGAPGATGHQQGGRRRVEGEGGGRRWAAGGPGGEGGLSRRPRPPARPPVRPPAAPSTPPAGSPGPADPRTQGAGGGRRGSRALIGCP